MAAARLRIPNHSCPPTPPPAPPGSTVELAATAEYMVRPPMPPVHFFLIDVSHPAITSGATAAACSSIAKILAELPGGERTQVGARAGEFFWRVAAVGWADNFRGQATFVGRQQQWALQAGQCGRWAVGGESWQEPQG